MSEYYLYACMLHGLLFAWSCWQVKAKGYAHHAPAKPKGFLQDVATDTEEVILTMANLGALEYVYCALLFLVALGSVYEHHEVNVASTGIAAFLSLIWLLFDLIMAFLSAIQFWHLKGAAAKAAAKSIAARARAAE